MRAQRFTAADDEMIRNAARLTGRKRQAVVNDALAAGIGLVLLHAQDPRAARAILDEIQQRLQVLHVAALAESAPVAPVDPVGPVAPVDPVEPVAPVEP